MQKIDFTGLSPEQIEYISTLEKAVENQQIRIEQLTELLSKSQKALYGQSSEKRRYVFGEDDYQTSLFNEAEVEVLTAKLKNPLYRLLWLRIPENPREPKKSLQKQFLS